MRGNRRRLSGPLRILSWGVGIFVGIPMLLIMLVATFFWINHQLYVLDVVKDKPLFAAIYWHDLNKVKHLLVTDTPTDVYCSVGDDDVPINPLVFAVDVGDYDIVKVLLDSDHWGVNETEGWNATALDYAGTNFRIAGLLRRYGAVHSKD